MIEAIPYLVLINFIAYFMMRQDKKYSKIKGARRIPEKRFFITAFIGGALGCWLGMRKYRHKTKHPSFVWGIPFLFLLNVVCLFGLYQLLERLI